MKNIVWNRGMAHRSELMVLGMGLLAMSGSGLSGQETTMELESYSMSASRLSLPVGLVGSSVTLLGTEDLTRMNRDMTTDVLRQVPGLYVRNTGGLGSAPGITMRGLPIAPVVLIDGVEVNDPGNGGIFNFGNLPVAQIASIEVLRGAQSALYGANALTGVISITTLTGEAGVSGGKLGLSYGSMDTRHGYATWSYGSDRASAFISGSRYESGGYSVQDPSWGPEWADDDLYRNTSFSGNGRLALWEDAFLRISGGYLISKNEYDPGIPDAWSAPVFDNYSEKDQVYGRAELGMRIAEGLESSLAVGYNWAENLAIDGFGERKDRVSMLKGDWFVRGSLIDGHQWVAGLEWKRAEDELGDHSMETRSVFVENVITVAGGLAITAALRHDHNSVYDGKTTWRTSFTHAFDGSGFRLKGSWGISYDAPEVSELFGTWGNPDLEPEDGRAYDFGFEQVLADGSLTFGGTFFAVRLNNRIEFLRSNYSYANVDWDSRGVEFFGRWDVGDGWLIQLSHSFADAKRKRFEDGVLFHSPENLSNLLIEKTFDGERLKLGMQTLLVSSRETWSGPTDGYLTLDLSMRYQISQGLEVWVRADNLLDKTYEEVFAYRSPGRSVRGGVNWEF